MTMCMQEREKDREREKRTLAAILHCSPYIGAATVAPPTADSKLALHTGQIVVYHSIQQTGFFLLGLLFSVGSVSFSQRDSHGKTLRRSRTLERIWVQHIPLFIALDNTNKSTSI